MQRLVNISSQMNDVPGQKSSLGRVVVHVLSQDFMGHAHNLQRAHSIFSVVDDRHHCVVDVRTASRYYYLSLKCQGSKRFIP